MMIWHIFKKDLKLLWPLVAIVAVIQFISAAIWLAMGHFFEPAALVQVAGLFPFAELLAMAALIVATVHQDVVPGERQDWLVRPIRRRDLIIEKLLFVLITVHGPLLLTDLAHGLVTGFSLGASFSVALPHGVFLLLVYSLPMLALAAMTSTTVEAVGAGLAIFLVLVLFLFAIDERDIPISTASDLGWMMFAFWSVLAIVAAAIIVPTQYFRRATGQARGIALGALLLLPLPAFVPWAPAFAFQQVLSADPAAAKAVGIAFDPGLGKYVMGSGGQNRANSIWLPLHVSGLPADSLLISDRADVRIIGRDGSVLFSGRTTGDPQVTGDPGAGPMHIDDFPVRSKAGEDVRTHQLITLPGKIYELVRGQEVRMELDYSVTLFEIGASDTFAALHDDKRSAGFGWCKTRLDYNGNAVQLGCIRPGNGMRPPCAIIVLENPVNGQRNPMSNVCFPDYPPYTMYTRVDVMAPFGYRLPVRDPQGLASYPVNSTQLADARVSLKEYKPAAHFTRHVVVPAIRLGDWEANAGITSSAGAADR